MKKIEVICETEVTIKMIGGKYKALILEYLIEHETKRFNEIQAYLQNISQRTLTNQLRELEKDGLISREVYAQVPPKVEYSITPKGRSLSTILEAMCAWGEKNIDDRFILANPQCS
ncbi:MAG: helix-turn-helix transcriptional regulator [Erysipelotrichaceae bacterium]|nr:helix-turn-helix transcriptional regulator [Erysipelotrichaceae bacterium]MDY5252733.1 helix-turn-helix domain-containing protein [Erysipelotrichaceae bacterium]